MQRISDKEWLFGLPVPRNSAVVVAAGTTSNVMESPATPEWSCPIVDALDVEDPANAIRRLRKLAVSGDPIIPLAQRVIDYARSEILLAPIARSEDSLRKFARGTDVLASFMAAELVDNDPRDLPDDALEGLYRRMIGRVKSIPNGDDTVRDLTGALRQFHSYMRNCHKKRRLNDKGILAPPVLLDRVDVDLLSQSEYLEVLRRINLRWPGTRNKDRRMIARCLAVLGATGLRREEARLPRTGDVQYQDWEGGDCSAVRGAHSEERQSTAEATC
jgi:hypothetical protein